MQIEFIGAAQTVTGSRHVVRTEHATVMLDCGLYQGKRREAAERNRSLGIDAGSVDAVVLSHAHIDHSGALPLLVKQGFAGPIYATPATRDLCAAMLTDAAMIQASDARFVNKLIDRGQSDMERVEPLYSERDVVRTLEQLVAVPYHRKQRIANGVDMTLLDAGHVLGSGITCLDVEQPGGTKRVVFTGDLGRRRLPILRDPELPEGARLLITESTYGDRLHKPIEQMDDDLAEVLARVIGRGGKLIIPSFALERAQEIVYALKVLRGQGRMPKVPVYVDSPLAVKLTDVFRMHPDCYDDEARKLMRGKESPFEFPELSYVSDKEDSKAISASTDPAIVISASGMCEAGRILHHLRSTIEDEKNCVMIVGYQAEHTLGRRLVERRPRVKIFGVERERRAEVVVMNSFSAHADQHDLVEFADSVKSRGNLDQIVLVHGDPKPQEILAGLLRERGHARVSAPKKGDRIEL